MIVVLDTNVIVSSLLSAHGSPAKIIGVWEDGQFEVAISPPLLEELERVLRYPRVQRYYKDPRATLDVFLNRLRRVAMVVEPQAALEVIEEDPADDRVLECAVAGRADCIVTGDAHLLSLKEYEGIVILKPADFVAFLSLRS